MRLRKKTLICIGVTIVSLIAALYLTSRTILLNSFIELEEQNTSQNVERVLSALSGELSSLDVFTSDWAAWDDTYIFIEDTNLDYIESNLVDETFIGAGLNLMLFINSSGGIVFGKAFDLQNETEAPVPQSFLELLSADNLLWRHSETDSSVNGIVLLSEDPMLIASRPIITSEEEGPIRGALIMGRYFNSEEINRLAETTHLSLIMRRFDDSQLPPDFQGALSYLSDEEPILTRPLDEESIAGYTVVKDIYGNPCLMFRVDMSRDIYKHGQASLSHLIVSLAVASLVFGQVSMLLLDKFVLSRLSNLSSSVKNIGESGDLSMRISVEGKDELSDLSDETNRMLSALEKAQYKVKRYSEHLEELVEERTKELKETHERLLKTERLAAVGEVAAMIGHDLRNPLTGIAGATYYLKTKVGPEMDKKSKEMLELIEKDIEYSNKIINDLQEHSREIRLDRVESTPKSIVMEALFLVQVPRNVQISDTTKSEPKIRIDVEKMKRVFVNIIKNAIEAMPKGGKLTIGSNEKNSSLEMVFTDTGTGIPEDTLEKIWKPLFTTKERGMGLGLSICKRIVEAHRGTISVESTVGKGTTFTVTFPIESKLEGGEEVCLNEQESSLSTTTKA